MATSYFTQQGDVYIPGDDAVGPWAPDMLHGRLFGGLAARAVEADHAGPGWRIARLTVDLFRAAGFDPVEVSTSLVRGGRRLRLVDVMILSGGTPVAAARAAVLVEGTPPPGNIWQAPHWASPHPETLPILEASREDAPEYPAWQLRVASGGFDSDERSRVWTNETGHLVDDEQVTPVVRAALNGDMASPLSNGSAAGIGYINGDYTLALARYPLGDWVGLEVTTHLAADGIALGACTLYDLDGPIGTSTTTALSNPILE